MSDIKSAWEIAQEKIEKIGSVTEEERLKWKYVPAGEKLAARYLKEDYNLGADLDQYDDNTGKYVIEGAQDILIRNIALPKNDITKKNNKRAMDGLKILKNDKVAVENVYSKIKHIFDHHAEQGEQQKQQAYESLKAEFRVKIQQSLQQQLGSASFTLADTDIERQPQFQEEWQKLRAQLELQYTKLLDEYKQELLSLS